MRLLNIVLIGGLLLLVGCANPSIGRVNDSSMSNVHIGKILVPRFEGNPSFVEESTDYFIVTLESQVSVSIIQTSSLRVESADIESGGNMVPSDVAIEAAKKVGADAVILGKVTSYSTMGTLNGFSTVRLISASNGEVLASFHRPSGLLIGNSEHQCVMAAVKRTANDVAKILK